MPLISIYDKGKKMTDEAAVNICKDCKFKRYNSTDRRMEKTGNTKCTKQIIIRGEAGDIIGLKSFWEKI